MKLNFKLSLIVIAIVVVIVVAVAKCFCKLHPAWQSGLIPKSLRAWATSRCRSGRTGKKRV